MKKILLDNQEFHFDQRYLPILIHGEAGSGASLFTISLLADLYSQGTKIIALTGFPMAREEFEKQTDANENTQFFTKENKNSFSETVKKLSDQNDYVILIKNIELFDEQTFEEVKKFNNAFISGDINKCTFKEKLLQKNFTTQIYFSQLNEALPSLQKYQGYLMSSNQTGIVSLEA